MFDKDEGEGKRCVFPKHLSMHAKPLYIIIEDNYTYYYRFMQLCSFLSIPYLNEENFP